MTIENKYGDNWENKEHTNQNYDFNDATFAYFISSDNNKLFNNHAVFSPYDLIISYSSNTNLYMLKTDDEELCIIGLCVDSHGEIERAKIPEFILQNGEKSIGQIVTLSARFAGKFVILYSNKEGIYTFTDATASLPINYNIGSDIICLSSYDNLIKTHLKYEISEVSLDIRKNADFRQPYPYNMTLCNEIKSLLPNHYLNLLTNTSLRYAPLPIDECAANTEEEQQQIIDLSIQIIDKIVAEYSKYYEIVCPLTSGRDSRLVLAFLRRHLPQIGCYTFNHKRFTENSGDYYIPPKICDEIGIRYCLIDDLTAPDAYVHQINEIIGEYYSKDTIDLAYTYNSSFKGMALINGDIIGQVGKSVIGNSLPPYFASPRFFVAKQHNFSKNMYAETKRYLDSVKDAGYYSRIYDLFTVENRLGRWVAQGGMIYSACAISSLNIFNCRELIESLMRIPRKLRKQGIIHQLIFEKISPELLAYPFNPSAKYGWAKDTVPTFLFATYAKYWLDKLKHNTK